MHGHLSEVVCFNMWSVPKSQVLALLLTVVSDVVSDGRSAVSMATADATSSTVVSPGWSRPVAVSTTSSSIS